MSEYPGFGVLLARLPGHRGLDTGNLPGTEKEKGELQAVLGGMAPGRLLLDRLAEALGMHVPDLYVIAGMEVPPDLAPLDAKAGPEAARLVRHAGRLPEDRLGELTRFARCLPQQGSHPRPGDRVRRRPRHPRGGAGRDRRHAPAART